MSQSWSVGTAVETAAVLLGCLVVLRLVLTAGATGLVRGAARASRALGRALLALRPGLARRLLAASVGIAAPAASVTPAIAAAGPAVVEPVTTAARPDAPPEVYVVRRGDTLWDIARRHLPAGAGPSRVARTWPRWYAANRGVIGPDPSLILPGQRLLVPGRRSAGTPTQPHAAPAPSPGTPVPSAQSLDPDRR